MGSATTTSTPTTAVDDLIKQVADEAGLEVSEQLASVPTGERSEKIDRSFFMPQLNKFLN